jgi:hypothetical protein
MPHRAAELREVMQYRAREGIRVDAGAGGTRPTFYLCAGDGCRDEIIAMDLVRFRAISRPADPGAGPVFDMVDAPVWAELSRLIAGRVGGRLQLDPVGQARLRRALEREGAFSTEMGGTATRIALGLANQHRTTHLACFHGAAELAPLIGPLEVPGDLTVSNLQPVPGAYVDDRASLPLHLILEIFDQTGSGGHLSEAIGRLSIEPPPRPVNGDAVVDSVRSLIAGLDADIDVVVVFSAVPLPVVDRCVAEVASRRRPVRFYLEVGEEVHRAGGPTSAADLAVLRRLGPAVTVSMNEPSWIGLTGSSDVSDEALASTYESWACGAIVVHREQDATAIARDESRRDLDCLERGVAIASLFAERGVLPTSAQVDARKGTMSGTTRTWSPPVGPGPTVRRSRVGVPVCRRPSRTVGLGDAFAAGFLVEMGAGPANRAAAPAVASI